MTAKIGLIFRKIASLGYMLGIASMLVGMLLSMINVPARAAGSSQANLSGEAAPFQANGCVLGEKIEGEDPIATWDAPAGKVICKIVIKTSIDKYTFTDDECQEASPGLTGYCASGIGSGSGEAERVCQEDGKINCHKISFVEFYIMDEPTPEPPTEVPPTEVPPTEVPPTEVPPTEVPPTDVTPTDVTPTDVTPSPEPTTATVTVEPPVVETPSPTTEPEESQPTPTPEEKTKVPPTVAPPPISSGTQPAVLIPVTGADYAIRGSSKGTDLYSRLFINLGIGLLGLALVFHGIGNQFRKIES